MGISDQVLQRIDEFLITKGPPIVWVWWHQIEVVRLVCLRPREDRDTLKRLFGSTYKEGVIRLEHLFDWCAICTLIAVGLICA